VTLFDIDGDKLTVELIANFPDFTIDPTRPSGFRNVNPFDLVVVGNQVYVTDGGQNLVRQVDLATGAFSTVVTFPQIANPIPGFPAFTEAVATGIAHNDGQLLVALFTGVPFPPGRSKVEQIDPLTGSHSMFIDGLKTAIDVRPIREGSETHYLVLQHASPTGPFFPPPPASAAFRNNGWSTDRGLQLLNETNLHRGG